MNLSPSTKSPALVCLDAPSVGNWRSDVMPVTVLNEASDLHARVAWCWSTAQELVSLADLLSESSNDDTRLTASFFARHLAPLATMLDILGTATSLHTSVEE